MWNHSHFSSFKSIFICIVLYSFQLKELKVQTCLFLDWCNDLQWPEFLRKKYGRFLPFFSVNRINGLFFVQSTENLVICNYHLPNEMKSIISKNHRFHNVSQLIVDLFAFNDITNGPTPDITTVAKWINSIFNHNYSNGISRFSRAANE